MDKLLKGLIEYIGMEKFVTENAAAMGLISVAAIVFFAKSAGLFYASSIEVLLMTKSDKVKRDSLSYSLVFLIFGFLNCSVFISDEVKIIYLVLVFLTLCVVFMLGIGKLLCFCKCWEEKVLSKHKFLEKIQQAYQWWKKYILWILMAFLFPLVTYVLNSYAEINIVCCVLLFSLVEGMIVILVYLIPVNPQSKTIIKIDDKEWYVFKRMDEDYLMCGDKDVIDQCNKVIMVELNTIIDGGIPLEIKNFKEKKKKSRKK